MNKIISRTPLNNGVQAMYRPMEKRDTLIVKLSLDPAVQQDERSYL